jgi:hypothetical protein
VEEADPVRPRLAPLVTGTVLSCAAAAAIARYDPGPAAWPHVSYRHPWTAYQAIAAAPFGNGWWVFAPTALIFALCLAVSGWRQHRRARPSGPED